MLERLEGFRSRQRIREAPLTNIRITNTRGGVQLTKDLLLLRFHHRGGALELGEEGRQIANTSRGPRVAPGTAQRTKVRSQTADKLLPGLRRFTGVQTVWMLASRQDTD